MKLGSIVTAFLFTAFIAFPASVEALFFPLLVPGLFAASPVGTGILAAGAGLAALTGLKIGGLIGSVSFKVF